MGAIARYDAMHIQPGKQKVKTVAVSPVARQANTRYLATAGVEEEYRKNLSRYSPEETDLLLKLFANYGIDGIRVINAGAKGLSKGLSTVQSRLEGLDELGLNPASVVNSHNGALSLNTDYIREKVPVVQTFLDRLKSDMSATRLINEKPKILARSASQLLAVSDMLEGSTDLIGHPAKDIEPFARHSIDTSFATLACKAQNSELVYAQDLERTKKLISADEQRQHNLERLHDTTVRQILSDRAIHAYMTARPLTEQERTAYPELASL
jgi:hypothetical protein